MNHSLIKVLVALSLSWVICSCSESNSYSSGNKVFVKQSPVALTYAKGFTIDTIPGGLQSIVIQDLNSQTQIAKYILVPKGSKYQPSADESIIHTPIDDIGVLSSSYIGFLDALNLTQNISIIENHEFIYHSGVLNQYKNGNTIEVGSNGQINLEKLVINAPQIIFTSAYNGGLSEDLLKAQDAGISIVQCSEWQENHPLARAEWIKLFGVLTDQKILADSLFQDIETNYKSISEKCKSASFQPNVLFSSMYQDIWYIPGGKSYIAKILQDVNATYAWSADDNTGSLQLSFESVATKAIQNDVWINPEVNSIEELLSRDPRYQSFVDNIKQGIFQQNAKTTPQGGNDYWESGVVRADWVLQDYAKIMHPQLFENTNFTYFNQIK